VDSSAPTCRREFLKTSLCGGLAAAAVGRLASPARASGNTPSAPSSRVALTTGEDHPEIIFRGLEAFRSEIVRAIGRRRVVIKPNNVSIDVQLSATHADCLEGILEFLKSIGKLENAVIAESAATGPTMEGFSNYGYPALAKKYGVKLLDLDQEEAKTVFVVDQNDLRPHPVKMSRMLLDEDNYILSAAKLKTHDLVVATLSLKNIVFGAPLKDLGFRYGKGRKPNTISQKRIVHGGGIHGINYNLFDMAKRLHPDLAVIDGFTAMEGNGPVRGTPVEHRVAVVSPDWLAADRVGVELMGIDPAKIGYLNYCASADMGGADIEKIEILGEPLSRHIRHYRLHDNVQEQLIWRTPPKQA